MEWRLRVLSLPTLVHSACQIDSELHISKKCSLDDYDNNINKMVLTCADQRFVFKPELGNNF